MPLIWAANHNIAPLLLPVLSPAYLSHRSSFAAFFCWFLLSLTPIGMPGSGTAPSPPWLSSACITVTCIILARSRVAWWECVAGGWQHSNLPAIALLLALSRPWCGFDCMWSFVAAVRLSVGDRDRRGAAMRIDGFRSSASLLCPEHGALGWQPLRHWTEPFNIAPMPLWPVQLRTLGTIIYHSPSSQCKAAGEAPAQ